MLSGAVVAGEGGSCSIYYNPANISDVSDNSNLSLSAAMFTWRIYTLKNVLGNGIDLKNSAFVVQPRFVTYVYNSPKSRFSIAGTVFTRIRERTEISYAGRKYIDILKNHPGDEQYNSYFDYRNRYDDTWVGLAGAYNVSPGINVGVSAFVSAVSMEYLQDIENSAVAFNDSDIFSAIYNSRMVADFNDFRVIFKIGMTYRIAHLHFGLNITTPSFTVLSRSKKLLHSQSQANITYKGKSLPDRVVFLAKEGKNVISHTKLPLSVALGMVYDFPNSNSHLYLSMEYFSGIKPYLSLEAYPNPQTEPEKFKHEWLSVASGSKRLTNVAVGFSWENTKNVGFRLGFRTDFNYLKNYDYGIYNGYNILHNSNADNYHFTAGAEYSILGQKIISGVEFTFSNAGKQKQIANFSDPVEYNPVDRIPLQGTIQHDATMHYLSINLYLSAVLNFGGNKDGRKERQTR